VAQLSSAVVVGGGKPALPRGAGLWLALVDHRRFEDGFIHLHYLNRRRGEARQTSLSRQPST
jgi:hypothetical protein